MNCPACDATGFDAVPSDGFIDMGDGTMAELATCAHCNGTRCRAEGLPLDYRIHLVNRKPGILAALRYRKECGRGRAATIYLGGF